MLFRSFYHKDTEISNRKTSLVVVDKRGIFRGADDGTFVAARCSFGLFRWAEKPSAPRLLLLPTKPAALWGLLLSWVQVRIMQKKHLSLRGAFLVRMMGLEPTGYCYH